MSLTDGQQRALEQLRAVEAAACGLITIEVSKQPTKRGEPLVTKMTMSCAGMQRADGGLPLKDVEEVMIQVPPDFPFRYPSAWTEHRRFGGFPHVHWNYWLCLYQAPATEWNPGDGMFGFLDRLYFWLQQGALDQLDPVGAPLHPPSVYLGDGPLRTVIPRVDTPPLDNEAWFGTAHLRTHSNVRVDIVGWSTIFGEDTPWSVAAAILLPTPFPYEYPTKLVDLLSALSDRGISRERLFLALKWAVINNEEEAPLYVVLGTPMRGTRGGELRQHLAAWYIEPGFAGALRTTLKKYSGNAEVRKIAERVEEIVMEWAQIAPVNWCSVREDRPEIVTRRDRGSPMSWFSGRSVAVWGCGALGAHVAEHLVRAGVSRLILRDNGFVTPGILVRQPFEDADIGVPKVAALAARLRRIRPDAEVQDLASNIIDEPLGEENWAEDVEVIIDASASTTVASLLERRRWMSDAPRVPLISMAIGHDAERGMVTICLPSHSGGSLDINRRLKLEACERPDLAVYLEEFWPSRIRPFFQPEPGCSDATFLGSSVDVAALSAMMLNAAARDLAAVRDGMTAVGRFLSQPHAIESGERTSWRSCWGADQVGEDIHAGYQIRISPPAWETIGSWIVRSTEAAGCRLETGGLLFGERDDAAGVIWVSEVSGPPLDSSASALEFVCGVEGTAEANAEKSARSRGSIGYVGMWHTHPESAPLPSPTDWMGMRRLVRDAGGDSRSLLLIVGCQHGVPMLGTYVFRAADFRSAFGNTIIRPCIIRAVEWRGA